ncbi:hypothetical protein ACWGI0_24205 [Streptomyces sp. NPDC054802]
MAVSTEQMQSFLLHLAETGQTVTCVVKHATVASILVAPVLGWAAPLLGIPYAAALCRLEAILQEQLLEMILTPAVPKDPSELQQA